MLFIRVRSPTGRFATVHYTESKEQVEMLCPIAPNMEQHASYTITRWEPKFKIPHRPGPRSRSNKGRKSIGSAASLPPERDEEAPNLSLPRGECHKPCLSGVLQGPGSLQALIHGRQPLRLPTPRSLPCGQAGERAARQTPPDSPAPRFPHGELGADSGLQAVARQETSPRLIPPAGPSSPGLSGLHWLASLIRG